MGRGTLGFNCVCNNVVQRLTQLWSIQIQLVICLRVTLEPRMAFPLHKTRPDPPVPILQGLCNLIQTSASEVTRGTLRFLPPLEIRTSSIARNPVESRETRPSSLWVSIHQVFIRMRGGGPWGASWSPSSTPKPPFGR